VCLLARGVGVVNAARWWRALRVAVAAVWLYQGLWLKLIAPSPRHVEIVAAVPVGLPPRMVLGAIGVLETTFGLATLCCWRPRTFAWLQIGALVAMNGMGIAFAAGSIPDIGGMVTMNLVFMLAIWGLACHAPH
jgi:uncharacterized membrane protein YphA (DoxX/SURF4 family)